MRGLQRLFQNRTHRLHQSLADLQRHVADKTIAHDYIGVSVIQVAAFHIAQEVQPKRLDELERIARELVALASLPRPPRAAQPADGWPWESVR